MKVEDVKTAGTQMIKILGLSYSPVGVRLLSDNEGLPKEVKILRQHRYCQAVMRARHGEHVLLDKDGISCPAAAAAFGFRPLPEGLTSGKGLVGFGIVSNEEVGKKMFEVMPKLKQGQIHTLHLFPLDKAEYLPDVVVVEDEVEKLMWICLAYLHAKGGERVQSSTSILQAACVDSTIIPYIEKRLNFGYGCYGCRDATDIGRNETLLGFPGNMLLEIVGHLEFLNKKAIPSLRAKNALASLQKRDS